MSLANARKVHTDRSRIQAYQRCPRLRWLEYHQDGIGLRSASYPLPLAVGGAVHVGLAVLLHEGQQVLTNKDGRWRDVAPLAWSNIEDEAVDAAIVELLKYRGSLALDTQEQVAQASAVAVPDDVMRQQLAESLGMSVEDAGLDALLTTQASGKAAFDDYLWKEQSGLVEGLVRAYARRRLRPLLEEFEVLEVEQEGTWKLWDGWFDTEHGVEHQYHVDVIFCSRPDALLRSRTDNSLYIMSFKTAATWDRRKELDAQHDMQGLSEGVEVERRLGAAWERINRPHYNMSDTEATDNYLKENGISNRVADFINGLPAPPRILGIRYEYLLKSYRGEDKDLSARFGFKCWSQRSHLVRQYVATGTPKRGDGGYSIGDTCWSYDYLKEDGSTSKLAWQNWKSQPVDNVKAWIDKLDASEEAMSAYDSTTGMEPRPLGWKSAAQAMGFTAEHPLDTCFVPPITVYRSDDQLRDWLEQVEAQEVRVAEAVARVDAASDEDERRSLLNVLFPQTRAACEYPSTCAFCAKGQDVCFGGEDIRRAPLESGKFVRRVPNHEAERESWARGVR